MEIEAYRTRFRGKNSFGVPFGDLIPVINEKDEPDSFATDGVTTFSVTTHDRGDIKQPTKEFYQIVFRIVGNDRKISLGPYKGYKIRFKNHMPRK